MKLTFEIDEGYGPPHDPSLALAIGNWMDPDVDPYEISSIYVVTLKDALELQKILEEFINRKQEAGQ